MKPRYWRAVTETTGGGARSCLYLRPVSDTLDVAQGYCGVIPASAMAFFQFSMS